MIFIIVLSFHLSGHILKGLYLTNVYQMSASLAYIHINSVYSKLTELILGKFLLEFISIDSRLCVL